MRSLRGTGVALVTPFTDSGEVDLHALDTLVNFVIDGGVDYLVVMGTTGESATLAKQEKDQAIKQVIVSNAQRLPIVIGIGGNNTAEVVATITNTDLSPFTAVLSVSPAYNKPTQEGIYQHFKTVAEASSIPVLLYNVPGRTASNMTPETIFRLANDLQNIVGVKEAKGDMVQAMRLIKDRPEGFMVISGDDMITLPMLLTGGDGVISVIGQGIPKRFTNMVNAALEGDIDKANELHYQIMPSIDLIFEEGNPAGIKSMLSHDGICNPNVRLPLVAASQDLSNRILDFLNSL